MAAVGFAKPANETFASETELLFGTPLFQNHKNLSVYGNLKLPQSISESKP